MPQKISFGFTIPQRGVFFGIATWPEMLAMAREVDRIALFDSVWVGDSVMAKPRPESIALLGALAGATSRVKLGVGCMASFPIRDPIIFAYQWATLDLISNDRMLLAACTGIVAGGVSANEGGAWNITDAQPATRMAEKNAICRRRCTAAHDGRSLGRCRHSRTVRGKSGRPRERQRKVDRASNHLMGSTRQFRLLG